MATLAIDFTWQRARGGYELRGERIFPKGNATEEHRPLDYYSSLYAQFAAVADDPQAFVAFMNLFGPLTHDAEFNGEDLQRLREMRYYMAKLISIRAAAPPQLLRLDNISSSRSEAIGKSWTRSTVRVHGQAAEGNEYQPLSLAANIVAVLRPGLPDGRPTLNLRPDTLWDAILLQFQQSLSSGTALKECGYCKKWFEVGPTGKRADARFCSDDCRNRAHLSGKDTKVKATKVKRGTRR